MFDLDQVQWKVPDLPSLDLGLVPDLPYQVDLPYLVLIVVVVADHLLVDLDGPDILDQDTLDLLEASSLDNVEACTCSQEHLDLACTFLVLEAVHEEEIQQPCWQPPSPALPSSEGPTGADIPNILPSSSS